eukprot:1183251-Prorocentrum_minimum.AAC.3
MSTPCFSPRRLRVASRVAAFAGARAGGGGGGGGEATARERGPGACPRGGGGGEAAAAGGGGARLPRPGRGAAQPRPRDGHAQPAVAREDGQGGGQGALLAVAVGGRAGDAAAAGPRPNARQGARAREAEKSQRASEGRTGATLSLASHVASP